MNKVLKIFILAMSSYISPAHAKCDCCAVPVATASGLFGSSISTSLAATYALLVDPLTIDLKTGMPTTFATILRQTQGTNSLESLKRINGIQDGLEAHKNSMITYHQQSEFAKVAKNALLEFPNIPSEACEAWVRRNDMRASRESLEDVARKGTSLRPVLVETITKDIKYFKDKIKDDPIAFSFGQISHPGCTPVFDSKVHAFESRTPISVGWNCDKVIFSKTIPENRRDKAQELINRMIEPDIIPASTMAARKTFAGQLYEKNKALYDAQLSLYRSQAQGALANYLPTHTMSQESAKSLNRYGIETPRSLKVSFMEYMDMHNRSRNMNPVFMAEMYQTGQKNVLLAYHQSQINKLAMTLEMYKQTNQAFLNEMIHQASLFEFNPSL